jgi:hypothetical protein
MLVDAGVGTDRVYGKGRRHGLGTVHRARRGGLGTVATVGMNRPCTRRRTRASAHAQIVRLQPGRPTAPEGGRLPLLPSGPDGVHGPSLRGTRPSTSSDGVGCEDRRPRPGIQPRCSGLRVQGTASSPPSTAAADGSRAVGIGQSGLLLRGAAPAILPGVMQRTMGAGFGVDSGLSVACAYHWRYGATTIGGVMRRCITWGNATTRPRQRVPRDGSNDEGRPRLLGMRAVGCCRVP